MGSEASDAAPADDRRARVEFVRFSIGDRAYALELGHVGQIVDDPSLTRVPLTGPTVAGITNVGGEITPVVDGRPLLEEPPRAPDADTYLLLLDRDDVRLVGLLVDDVDGIETHPVEDIDAPGAREEWDQAVGPRWFRAVVANPARPDRPTGVFDVAAIVGEARVER